MNYIPAGLTILAAALAIAACQPLTTFAQGVAEGRKQAIDHLRDKANQQTGEVGDARRRGCLNAAADELRDGREPGR